MAKIMAEKVARNKPGCSTCDSSMGIRDFNDDGKPDIAIGRYSGVAILEGNSNGTFQNPVYSNPTTCCGMVAEGINRDGKLDLVSNSDGVLAMLGNGSSAALPY